MNEAKQLIGKSFLYGGKQVKVENVSERNGTVTVYTDKVAQEYPLKGWRKKFDRDFLPVEESPMPAVAGKEAGLTVVDPLRQQVGSLAGELRGILFDALKEVQAGGDIKKAKFALDTVKTITNVSRLELDAAKFSRKGNES